MHLKVKVHKVHLEVESFTSGTRWKLIIALKWYNYRDCECHALKERNVFFKRTKRHIMGGWVKEVME
jgi:hypothetical protein